mmetsp:Transcript_11043/g.27783  ORF Transcript_11043/g.27783 Transcript_11043/m.27783 type:complete len:122 (-) Transcript_11043:412-777(-)
MCDCFHGIPAVHARSHAPDPISDWAVMVTATAEMLSEGTVGLSGDVWAFGILMWEMYTGFRAHQGKKVGNIIFVVTSGQGKLELPPEAAEEYKDIMNACLDYDPSKRPTFKELSSRLQALF